MRKLLSIGTVIVIIDYEETITESLSSKTRKEAIRREMQEHPKPSEDRLIAIRDELAELDSTLYPMQANIEKITFLEEFINQPNPETERAPNPHSFSLSNQYFNEVSQAIQQLKEEVGKKEMMLGEYLGLHLPF